MLDPVKNVGVDIATTSAELLFISKNSSLYSSMELKYSVFGINNCVSSGANNTSDAGFNEIFEKFQNPFWI
jgi:hypothetical protein